MKILLVANKTYRGLPDSILWYFWEPLIKLDHEVYFYDTVAGSEDGDFTHVVRRFEPDLIFCVMTGNKFITPYEPWDELLQITQAGNIKTFNWFCDDTWRFNDFSAIACSHFTVCSTPERTHVEKYKDIGYENIIVANWHANSEWYPKIDFKDKQVHTSFIGAPNASREQFFNAAGVEITYFHGISQKQMFEAFSNSKMSVNLSVNNNDPDKKTQMKQRLFEIPAGAGMLITEYHEGIEEYFELDREILTFSTTEEFREKINFMNKHPKIVEDIAKSGHERFIKEHDSKVRLRKTLEEIMNV
jgi:spore maturation protein CgeB